MRSAATAARLATVLLFGTLVGCDGDGGSGSPTTVDARPAPVTVVADEHSYSPATLVLDGPLRVRLDNVGSLAHTWTVMAERVADEIEMTTDLVLAEARAEPGQSSVIDLAGLAPGSYQIVCTIPGHFSAGMVGDLVIET